jgi:hypothetical protein
MPTYYISNEAGASDSNPGTITSPWASFIPASEQVFPAGTSILARCGDTFRYVLRPTPGTTGNRTVYGSYGTGPAPKIKPCLLKTNVAHWDYMGQGLWKTKLFNQAPDGPEMVYNGDFNTYPSGWTLAYSGTANATAGEYTDTEISHQALGIQINSPGSAPQDILLYPTTSTTSLTKYTVYRLQMYAKAAPGFSGAVIPNASVISLTGSPIQELKSTTTPMSFGTSFHSGALITKWFMAKADVPSARLTIELGGMGVPAGYQMALVHISCVSCGTMFPFYDPVSLPMALDVGHMSIANRVYGWKGRSLSDIDKPNMFWSDPVNWDFWVFSTVNPGMLTTELAMNQAAVVIHSVDHTEVTGFEISTTGGTAVSWSAANDSLIHNNYVHHVGGSFLPATGMPSTDVSGPRAGNGIELFGAGSGLYAYNNTICEVYDVATTVQGRTDAVSDVHFYGNTCYSCEQMIEVWQTYSSASMTNVSWYNNLFIGAGYGWSRKIRPDPKGVHILQYHNAGSLSGVTIQNNVFAFWRDSYRFSNSVIGTGWVQDNNAVIGRPNDPLFTEFDESTLATTTSFTIQTLAAYAAATGFEGASTAIQAAIPRDFGYGTTFASKPVASGGYAEIQYHEPWSGGATKWLLMTTTPTPGGG